ncbi:MAG: MATE family efflux transporter [Mangrovibacterium sp.]
MDRQILRLALPNIISNVTIPLIGLVDMALMGHLNSEVYIGAVSLGTVIFNFIYWGFSFLRMSTSGSTAQSFGEGNQAESFNILKRAMLISVFISLIIILLQAPIAWISFSAINGSAEVEELARQYFRVRLWAAPATLGLYALNGWFLGMQNARYVMVTSILANVLNLVFSFVFVYFFHLDAVGVALGTVIAEYTGIGIGLYLLRKKYGPFVSARNWEGVLDISAMKEFFRVNTDIFIRTFCVIVVFTFFTSKSASMNDHTLAVNSILIQFLLLFSFFIDGFAFAGEALAGRYQGEQCRDLFLQLTRRLFVWGLGLAIVFSLLFLVGNKFIIGLLTSQESLYETARKYLFWVVLTPLITVASFVWDGIYIGVTASREMRNSMLAATLLVFAPTFYFLQNLLGNHALWLAMMLFMAGRGIFQTLLFPRVLKKNFAE